MSLKSRKAELKQRGKLSLAKYAGMIVATIRYIFTNTKPRIFRIPKKKGTRNTPSRRSNHNYKFRNYKNI